MSVLLERVRREEEPTTEEEILKEMLRITRLRVLPIYAKTFRSLFIFPLKTILSLRNAIGELKIFAFKISTKSGWSLSIMVDGKPFLEQSTYDELEELTRFSKVITAIYDSGTGEYYVALEDIPFSESITITIFTAKPLIFPLLRYEIVYTKR